jgi:hypothetical protein
MLFLLQLKVVWGMWHHRDLTSGDTAGYFARAYLWAEHLSVDIIWSPLYTAFYGTLLFLSTDAYAITILHRLLIIFAMGAMILAVMRRLLPHGIAWIIAAWWVILPTNFDALYEVHLFAVIPVLAVWLLVLHKPSPWTLGSAIAVLLLSSVLVRNELVLATGVFALICLWWEIRQMNSAGINDATFDRRSKRLMAYAVPVFLAVLICLFFYSRAIFQFPSLTHGMLEKHTVNMCQVYAFGYQQRHPEWKRSPWSECKELAKAHFGIASPTLADMFHQNPRAILENILWNISLVPSGIQVLLFNATAGSVTPDYVPVSLQSKAALVLSLITGGVLVCGGCLLYRQRRYWWEYWLRDRALGWLAMLSVALVAGIIIPTQRPRPSYLFSLGIVLMAAVGMSSFVIARLWPVLRKASRWTPLFMLTILLATPSYYLASDRAQRPRPLLELYRRLAPFGSVVAQSHTVSLVNRYPLDVHFYVGHNYLKDPARTLDYTVLNEWHAATPPDVFLNGHGIDLFYVDEVLLRRFLSTPLYKSFVNDPEAVGWTLVAPRDGGEQNWRLFLRNTPGVLRPPPDQSYCPPLLRVPFRLSTVYELAAKPSARAMNAATSSALSGSSS